MKSVSVIVAFVVLGSVVVENSPQKSLLDPDFEIRTPAGNQVFREELAIALTKTSGATPQTRQKFKREAEQLAQKLFRKGQKEYKLPHANLKVYWDSLRPIEVAMSHSSAKYYDIHLNEIMFFSYHEEHLKSVIPHEVAHLLERQLWGNANPSHSQTFWWVVQFLAPGYQQIEFDLTPACRLSAGLIKANGNFGSDPACEK